MLRILEIILRNGESCVTVDQRNPHLNSTSHPCSTTPVMLKGQLCFRTSVLDHERQHGHWAELANHTQLERIKPLLTQVMYALIVQGG